MKTRTTIAAKPSALCSHMPGYPEVTYTPGTGLLKLISISLSMQGSLCLLIALLCKAEAESVPPMRITLWGRDTHYVSRSLVIGLRMSIWRWWWYVAMWRMRYMLSTSMGLMGYMAQATHGHGAHSPQHTEHRAPGGPGLSMPFTPWGARGQGAQRPGAAHEAASSNIHTSFRGRGVSWTDHPARPLIFFENFSCKVSPLTSVKLQGFGYLGVT